MDVAVKRRYHSPQRAEQANATRREVMEAARRLFSTRGFGRTTIEAVAAAAGVSVATVYLVFGTKLGLISALMRQAAEDPALDVQQVLGTSELAARVKVGARLIRELHERTSGMTMILRSGLGNDAGLEALWLEWQAGHLAAVSKVARHLAKEGELRSGVSVEGAADILYVLTGSETFRQLVVERGWSPGRFEEWLGASIQQLVLPSPTADVSGPVR